MIQIYNIGGHKIVHLPDRAVLVTTNEADGYPATGSMLKRAIAKLFIKLWLK